MERPMQDLVLMSIEYGGYISIVKLVTFLVLFFLWLPLLSWVYNDAKSMETKEVFWTGIVLGAGAAALIIWLIIPVFIAGMLLYIIVITATSLAYVKHRNSIVMDYDRVLTADHIKGLFVSEEKKLDDLKNIVFITANNNQVPLPEPKTPDFFGYKAACGILNDAKWKRASSIILSPTPQGYNITYYVDGAALNQPAIAQEQTEFFIRFVKNLADLDADEKRKPQKGKFSIVRQKENPDEWEVTTAGSTAGEQVKLKQIVKQGEIRLTDISLMPEQYEQLNKLQGLKQGLFLITGPKKSGVTTTLYALLRNHDAFINSINTLERQSSAKLPNITQNIYTLSDTGTTSFAKKLQQVIRLGPDIVGVADCDDAETAKVACAGSRDGKMIYVTLNADSAMQALGSWIKLVGDKKAAAMTLLGISNQRLLRKLCTECKQAYTPDKELLRKFNIAPEKTKVLYRAGKVQYDKRGRESTCENCQGTGYIGRTGVFEIIILNDELRKVILQSRSLSEISSKFRRANILYLQEQTMRKVITGITDVNEMIRALSKPKR
jgi:type II secretory ATPase GspE/PulE/Tfp pilus assembly ATPase PilB-like protein